MEKVTKDVAVTHFFLMFGYKIFSLYFPLFLVARGMSLPEVGYTYLLIYLPLALFSPVAGFLNHKINPAILITLGILGYGAYSLGMILIQSPVLFFLWQVLLGISAALFFVSAKSILMGYPLKNANRALGWFHSAPFYTDAIAPAVGAFFIWKFDFLGVFILSLIIYFFAAIYSFIRLRKPASTLPDKGFNLQKSRQNYKEIFSIIKQNRILPLISISFSILFLAGFYRSYFPLFLKDELFWSQNLILVFISLFSFLFFPISLLVIKRLEKSKIKENIFKGGLVGGIFSILFGAAIPFLNFVFILLINLGRSAGNLLCNAARSGLVFQSLKKQPEEAGSIDTIIAPLATALGALTAGLIIGFLGYGPLFIIGGIFVILVSLSVGFAKKIDLM